MDKKQSKFPKDFFKQFKRKDDFQSFFSDLYKQGVEEMLKGELDEHLGYENTVKKVTTPAIAVMALIPRK